MNRNVVGGSACPPSMLAAFKNDYNCDTIHAWGMTKPVHWFCQPTLKPKHQQLSEQRAFQAASSQGRPPFGVDLRLTDEEKGSMKLPAMVSRLEIYKLKGTGLLTVTLVKMNLHSRPMAGLTQVILQP